MYNLAPVPDDSTNPRSPSVKFAIGKESRVSNAETVLGAKIAETVAESKPTVPITVCLFFLCVDSLMIYHTFLEINRFPFRYNNP